MPKTNMGGSLADIPRGRLRWRARSRIGGRDAHAL